MKIRCFAINIRTDPVVDLRVSATPRWEFTRHTVGNLTALAIELM
jgi:hypothetical protein